MSVLLTNNLCGRIIKHEQQYLKIPNRLKKVVFPCDMHVSTDMKIIFENFRTNTWIWIFVCFDKKTISEGKFYGMKTLLSDIAKIWNINWDLRLFDSVIRQGFLVEFFFLWTDVSCVYTTVSASRSKISNLFDTGKGEGRFRCE